MNETTEKATHINISVSLVTQDVAQLQLCTNLLRQVIVPAF